MAEFRVETDSMGEVQVPSTVRPTATQPIAPRRVPATTTSAMPSGSSVRWMQTAASGSSLP